LDYSFRVANLLTEMVEALKELTLRGRLDQIQIVLLGRMEMLAAVGLAQVGADARTPAPPAGSRR
jgi:hypothetical protein